MEDRKTVMFETDIAPFQIIKGNLYKERIENEISKIKRS
jgi:hypothetical protein